jgi:hypothetical protein
LKIFFLLLSAFPLPPSHQSIPLPALHPYPPPNPLSVKPFHLPAYINFAYSIILSYLRNRYTFLSISFRDNLPCNNSLKDIDE